MIFVDTGPLLARYVERDQYHAQAIASWSRLAATPQPLCTSNFVIDEFVTLLARRAGNRFAVERAKVLYASRAITILRSQPEDEVAALEWIERLSDQSLSFTDCVSFALMTRQGVSKAFTYDHHFDAAGFERWE